MLFLGQIMNLSKIQEIYFKDRKKVILIFAALLILFLGAWLSWQKYFAVPEEDKLPPFALTGETGSIVGQIDFSQLSFPSSIQVTLSYKATPLDNIFSDSAASALASRFGFTGAPRKSSGREAGEETWGFINGLEEALTINNKPREVIFSAARRVGEGSLYDPSAGVEKAKQFLTDKNLPADGLALVKTNYIKVNVGTTEDPSQADFLEVYFAWSIGDRKIFGEGEAQTAIVLIFNRQGEVVYLKYVYLDSTFTKFSDVKLISFAEASNQLREKGLVIFALPLEGTVGEGEASLDLLTFVPSRAELVYVQPQDSGFVYPVYLFEGKGTTDSGEVEASVYLLAVSPDYLRSSGE